MYFLFYGSEYRMVGCFPLLSFFIRDSSTQVSINNSNILICVF